MDVVLAVAAAVLLGACATAWSLRRSARGRRAWRGRDGEQEAFIVVQRGYRPSRVELEAGIPATLRFDRREDDACSEMLVSDLWPTAHRLAAHRETEVRFTPQRPGRYAFTCGLGMYSGEIVVRAPRVVAPAAWT